MTIKEIFEKCKTLNIYEERSFDDGYLELVFYTKETEQWDKVLVDILGSAVKPAGRKPAPDDLELTKEFGGVYDNQTLYKKEFDNGVIVAMFWPWQDAVRTTLKVALVKK